jgi:hypothetical protein
MTRFLGIAMGLACLLGAMRTARAETIHPGVGIRLDSARLSAEARQLLKSDIAHLAGLRIQAPAGSYFEQVFGGRGAQAVVRYLDRRIDYISRADEDDYYATNQATLWKLYGPGAELGLIGPGDDPWYDGIPFESGRVPLREPGTGFLHLGNLFFDELDRVGRLETLVHEARHTDCPRALSERDLRLFVEATLTGTEEGWVETIEAGGGFSSAGRRCNYEHVPCADGETSLMCDREAWGPNMVAIVFMHALWKYCASCTDAERESAAYWRDDSLENRLLPGLRQQLQSGNIPAPDMSSL